MRIWSIHPKYLDSKGLVALWRETLLAKHVLMGMTKGYRNHPQLGRFKESHDPIGCIDFYLSEVYKEALVRQFHFDKSKFSPSPKKRSVTVTQGQLDYERLHALSKLKVRDPQRFSTFQIIPKFEPHPLFNVVPGDVEAWEIVKELL
jgi:hypothetical protein